MHGGAGTTAQAQGRMVVVTELQEVEQTQVLNADK